jgi:branched-subunit amino acid ABC-type transport system permease component
VNLAVTAVLTGLAVGSVYGLIAIGYTVVFNATRVFNLAQGDLVMVGVLLSYYALEILHWPQAAAFMVVVTGTTMLAVFEERFVVRPFLGRKRDNIGWFIATLAFSLVIETVAINLYGYRPPEPIPSPLSDRALHVGSAVISPQLLLAVVALVVITVGIEGFYHHTWVGRSMRATAQDRDLAAMRGIEPGAMSMLAFALAGLLAGVGGYVIGPIVLSNVSIGLTYSLKGFITLAVGGFGSIRGAIVGAWALGVAEQLFDLYGSPRYELVVGLALLMLVLAVRPTGLYGGELARRV